ncbi:unnamed protein product, partial [Allacma fusca]
VVELEYLLKQSPKKFPQFLPNASSNSPDLSSMQMNGEEPGRMCKVAERVKLSQKSSSPSPSHKFNHKKNQENNNNNNNHHHHHPSNNNNCHHHHHHHQSILLNMNSVVQIQQQQGQKQISPDLQNSKNGRNHHHSSPKNNSSFISGQELVAIGNSCSTRIVEHLVQPLQDESTVTEMQQAFAQSSQSMAEEKVREFEIETERLNSRLEHLRSQNDVLTLNLDDAKSHADRLTVLLGKYESNNVGHQIALSFSDQLIEAYDVLVALLESELGLLLANCRAAGIGATSGGNCGNGSETIEDDIDVATLLHRANENRMTAEIAARNLLIRMVESPGSENNNGIMLHLPIPHHSNLPPWEDASSCSQTLRSALLYITLCHLPSMN